MKKIDDERLSLNRPAFAKAQAAVALALRTDTAIDRAFLAMPRLRDRLAEATALAAIGCAAREPASNAELAELSRDTQFANAYRAARAIALTVAKAALKGIEIVEPEPAK